MLAQDGLHRQCQRKTTRILEMAKNTLTVVLNDADLGDLALACPPALDGTILALDVDVHVKLTTEGREHITCWDVVSESEFRQVLGFEQAVQGFWQKHASALFEGIDCLAMTGFRHVTCFTRISWLAHVFKRTIEETNPSVVITFDEPIGHGLEQPPGYTHMPLAYSLLRGMAEQAGIRVHAVKRPAGQSESSFCDQVAMQAHRELPTIDVAAVLGNTKYTLFSASGTAIEAQLPLIRQLHRPRTTEVVQLYKSADDSTIARMSQEKHHFWHESQLDHKRSIETESWIHAAREAFDEQRRACPEPLRCVFDNPYLDTHFEFIFGPYLERMAWHVANWQTFLSNHRPSLAVANYPVAILDVAAHMGIPTLMLPHGSMIIGETRLYKTLPTTTAIGAISPLHASRLQQAGLSSKRIYCTVVLHDSQEESRVSSAADATPDPHRKRILLCTCITALPSTTGYIPQANWARAVADFVAIGELAARRPEWRFLVKCHPRWDHHALYRYINEHLPQQCKMEVLAANPMESCAALADAIVVPNVKSSAIVEASAFRKPVIFLDSAMSWYDHEQWGTTAWPRASSVGKLEEILDDIFSDEQEYERYVTATSEALVEFLGPDRDAAMQRTVDVIRTLSAAADN